MPEKPARLNAPLKWADNIWTVEGGPLTFLTVPFGTRMTLIRLQNGELLVISPVALDHVDTAAVENLGAVAHLASPNKLHHFYLSEWKEKYPQARVYASPGLEKKRSDIVFDAILGDTPESRWAQDVDQTVMGGSFLFNEIIFFHRTSRSLIVTDLIQRHDPDSFNWFHRQIARADGLLEGQNVMPRDWRMTVTDRKAARAAARKILDWEPQRILIAHGRCVTQDAMGHLRNAFRWLLD